MVYLPPVPEEVIAEDLFCCVFVIQHLSKEKCHFLSWQAEFHCLSYNKKNIFTYDKDISVKKSNQLTTNYELFG